MSYLGATGRRATFEPRPLPDDRLGRAELLRAILAAEEAAALWAGIGRADQARLFAAKAYAGRLRLAAMPGRESEGGPP